MDPVGALLPILLVVGAFYLLILRPARARQAAARATASQLTPGVRIMTTAGLFGRVVAVDGDEIDLEIAPGVTVRYVSAAVAKVMPDPTEEETSEGTLGEAQASSEEDDTPGA